MQTSRLLALAVGAVLLASCGGGGSPRIEVVGTPQVAEPAAGSSQVAITLSNTGDGDDRLVGATTAAALGTALHRSTITDGVASMTEVDAIDLPAGEQVAFRPGETHLMLVVPDETVRVGGTLELVLDFERSEDVTVDVAVVELDELFERAFDTASEDEDPA